MTLTHWCDTKYGIRPVRHLDLDESCENCGYNYTYGMPYVEPLWLRFIRWLAK